MVNGKDCTLRQRNAHSGCAASGEARTVMLGTGLFFVPTLSDVYLWNDALLRAEVFTSCGASLPGSSELN